MLALPSPGRSDLAIDTVVIVVMTKRGCRPRLPEGAQAVGAEGPGRRLAGDAAASAQHVAGDGQFVGRGTDVGAGGVQDEVLEMDEFAVEPQRGAGVGEVLAFNPALTDRRASDALVETGQGGGCRFYFAISNGRTSYVC